MHTFQRDDAPPWRKIFQIVINIHFKEYHDYKKNYGVYIYIYSKWILIWNGIGICFQTDVAMFQRECTESGHTFFKEYHVLWKIRLGITDIAGLYFKKLPNSCPKCTLSALFCFNFFSHCFWNFRKLDENRWNTKLPSTYAQVSEHLIFPTLGTRRQELAGAMM